MRAFYPSRFSRKEVPTCPADLRQYTGSNHWFGSSHGLTENYSGPEVGFEDPKAVSEPYR